MAVDIEALREQNTDEFSPIPMPLLPSYQVGDSQYILLMDIQLVFNLREGHCIAFIAPKFGG